MPTITEIAQMRQQGMLREAYDAINAELKEHPEDYSAVLTAGWIYHDLLKQNAQYPTRGEFDRFLKEFLALGVRPEDFSIYESVMWDIRRMLSSVANIENLDHEWLESLIATLRSLPVQKNSAAYHSLLSAAIKIRNWPGVIEFINWWGLEHLTEEDYRPNTNSQGMSYMGLAETTYYALCRAMLMLDDAARQNAFIEKIQRVTDRHPEYRFLPYYTAKLMLRLGRREEAMALLKTYARDNTSAFWVWQLLGDEHRDVNDKMMFYLKAVSCPAAANMTVKLNEQVGRFLISRNMVEMGKYLIEKAVRTRQREGSHVPYAIENMRREIWYQEIDEHWDEEFAKTQSERAEQFLFADLQQFAVLVTYVNQTKHIVSFLSEQLREGYFRLPEDTTVLPEKWQVLIISATQLNEGTPTNVRQFTTDTSMSNPAFFKPFEGVLKLNYRGFGFVEGVFVEPRLVGELANGAAVHGIACKTFNKTKQEWNLAAVSIEHD